MINMMIFSTYCLNHNLYITHIYIAYCYLYPIESHPNIIYYSFNYSICNISLPLLLSY